MKMMNEMREAILAEIHNNPKVKRSDMVFLLSALGWNDLRNEMSSEMVVEIVGRYGPPSLDGVRLVEDFDAEVPWRLMLMVSAT